MKVLRMLWAMWKHGASIALVYGFSVLIAFGMVAITIYLGNSLLSLIGWGMDEETLGRTFVHWAWLLWGPLGIGIGARRIPSNDLKPDQYPEPDRPEL